MQLSTYDHLTTANIIFNEAKEYKVKDSKIRYKRIPIEVKYPNGKKGALVIETPLLFSFGVNEKKNQETNKLVGYSMPVCLWSKDSEPNTKEQAFFDVINNVMELCKLHLESEYGADLASSLSSPFYYKQIEYTDKKGKYFFEFICNRSVKKIKSHRMKTIIHKMRRVKNDQTSQCFQFIRPFDLIIEDRMSSLQFLLPTPLSIKKLKPLLATELEH